MYKTTRKGTIKRKVTTTRKVTLKRKATDTLSTPITKRVKGKHDTDGSESSSFNSKAFQNNHTYMCYQEEQTEICNCQSLLCFKCSKEILHVYEENERCQKENQALKKLQNEATDVLEQDKEGGKYSVDRLKDCDPLIKLHTGLDSYALFEWTYDQVKHKLDYLQYYKGSNSHTVKKCQANKGKKLGPQRMLSLQNKRFLTLIKLHLNLNN